MVNYDFSGWATKNNLRCSDGRVILKDAFKDNDGETVPLVWNHQHNGPENVLGHALLRNHPRGVRAYCTFNDTEQGQSAKLLVEHGDISALSIYANQLQQNQNNVLHGAIREVSLVLAGANPGAFIDSVMAHGEEDTEAGIIYTGESIYLSHSDDSDETFGDVIETLTDKQKTVIFAIIAQLLGGENEGRNRQMRHNDYDMDELFHSDVLDDLTDEQMDAVYELVGQALEDAEDEYDDEYDDDDEYYDDDDDDEYYDDEDYDDEEEYGSMKHNVFDMDDEMEGNVLSHSATEAIIGDAKTFGSMKESFLAHAQDYGIESIDWLFPDAKNLNTPPDFIKRDIGWVKKFMGSVHHTPFSRIKSMFADITEDEARAKGYIKGKLKKEEVFSLLKRTTMPTTIYKKQKMDRDDVIDITDFDVIAWLKTEMRMMLDEEIARAILVGDGRLASSDDKINEQNIRPIWKDEDLYTIKAAVKVTADTTADERAKAFIRAVIKSRKNYKGSGDPTLYTTEDHLTDCLLLEDGVGRVIYDSVAKLATVLRVKEIVTVPVMEGLSRTDEAGNKFDLAGIIVNPTDYNVGADKGGAINMFDDFDIDYNQQKYLIETRCSGALTKPFSAIALEFETEKAAG